MDVRQVYGGRDDGGREPGHVYAVLEGGPLDGRRLDVTGWSAGERTEGALLITDQGLYGPGGRAFYAPGAAGIDGPFLWYGDTP